MTPVCPGIRDENGRTSLWLFLLYRPFLKSDNNTNLLYKYQRVHFLIHTRGQFLYLYVESLIQALVHDPEVAALGFGLFELVL